MNRTNTLSQRIKSYTLLAGSMLVSAAAAEAQVVYTDVNPDRVMGGDIPNVYPELSRDSIDLNNDGIYDFRLTLKVSSAMPDAITTNPGFYFYEKIDAGFDPQHNNIFTYSVEYAPIAFKMDCNDSVPLNQQFYGLSYAVLSFQFSFWAHNWFDVHDKYVGVKFDIGGENHFGWIRLDVNTTDTIPNIVLKSYAYEATPDKKIAVCDTGLPISGVQNILNAENALSVFPNPSRGNCVVRIDKSVIGAVEVSVNDVSGKEVYSTSLQTNGQVEDFPLDLPKLSSGLYFIHLKSATNSAAVKWTKL